MVLCYVCVCVNFARWQKEFELRANKLNLMSIEDDRRRRDRDKYQLPMKLNDNDDIDERTCLCLEHLLSSSHFHGYHIRVCVCVSNDRTCNVHRVNLVVGRTNEADTRTQIK